MSVNKSTDTSSSDKEPLSDESNATGKDDRENASIASRIHSSASGLARDVFSNRGSAGAASATSSLASSGINAQKGSSTVGASATGFLQNAASSSVNSSRSESIRLPEAFRSSRQGGVAIESERDSFLGHESLDHYAASTVFPMNQARARPDEWVQEYRAEEQIRGDDDSLYTAFLAKEKQHEQQPHEPSQDGAEVVALLNNHDSTNFSSLADDIAADVQSEAITAEALFPPDDLAYDPPQRAIAAQMRASLRPYGYSSDTQQQGRSSSAHEIDSDEYYDALFRELVSWGTPDPAVSARALLAEVERLEQKRVNTQQTLNWSLLDQSSQTPWSESVRVRRLAMIVGHLRDVAATSSVAPTSSPLEETVKRILCPDCGFEYGTMAHLWMHEKVMHGGQASKVETELQNLYAILHPGSKAGSP